VIETNVLHRQLVDVREDERMIFWRRPLLVDELPAWRDIIDASGSHVVHHVGLDDPGTPADVAAWHRAQGHRSVAILPLRRGDGISGLIGLAYRAEIDMTAERLGVAQALARQATVALDLTRLTESAKLAAVVDERTRLARDIHDHLAQALALIVMQLADAQDKLGPAWETAREPLETVRQLAVDSLAAARRSVSMLRPTSATALGLPRAVQGVADLVRRYFNGRLAVRVTGTPQFVQSTAEVELLGIVRESLMNAARHSRATRIDVELAFLENRTVRVVVADNGQGFDPDRTRPGSYGLVGMHERAARIGAALTLVTEPGAGTEVVVLWPA
jgi:signal transduction histidine kinase